MRKYVEQLNRPFGVALVCLLLLLLAWCNRFIQDDAFISLRYAHHFATDRGLSWNPGERVEGYTNFLWTVLLAAAFWLHLEPVIFSQLLGVLTAALTASKSLNGQ